MSCNTNTYPDDIYAYISVVLTSGPLQPARMWQVPLCALTVIGPEVNTENRCRHL